MFDHYKFYDNDEDLTKIQLGGKTAGSLPDPAGYDGAKFKQDIAAIFENKKRHKTADVKETWTDHVLYKGNTSEDAYANKFMSVGQARDAAEGFGKFYERLEDSSLKKTLMQFYDGDAKRSTQTIMDWIEYHADPNAPPDQLPGDLMNAMDKLEKNSPEELKALFGGKEAGNESRFNPVRLRIAELLPKVRRKYEFAAVKSYTYEPIFYPEDDVDVRSMQSYGEILRIPKPLLGCHDDEFYPRMATKSFPVMEYRRAIPMPKKFVILVDVSGSMDSALEDGYKRSEYAQATAIALAEQAEEGGNQCEVIYFETHAYPPITGTPRQIQEKLFAEQFQGGGTSFEAAFRAADKTNADSVVLVTDGQASFKKPPRAPLMTLICGGGERIPNLENASYRYENVI